MEKKELFLEALGKLRARFPTAFAGLGVLPNRDWDDESGMIRLLEEFIGRCSGDALGNYYKQGLSDFYEQEVAKDSTVGTRRPSLEMRCRAFIQAIDDLS